MTNEKMLATISDIANYLDAEDRKAFDFIVSKQEDFQMLSVFPQCLLH